jgi:hypothetical protein
LHRFERPQDKHCGESCGKEGYLWRDEGGGRIVILHSIFLKTLYFRETIRIACNSNISCNCLAGLESVEGLVSGTLNFQFCRALLHKNMTNSVEKQNIVLFDVEKKTCTI